ncbi:S1C family serine protease [Jeotgalibacillus sp. ET6]|uniref:S1C family serine protease n=1 Tax=Jeotgalibacillus sp. ET6 TaxID=3037260 RepID=UPI0024181EB9|nr:S1C family serine protease [Jeotgalibacillus sp. ET6]MDG5472940.1 S1C family serine protease [Jeotgalibacillus sp. ET6]
MRMNWAASILLSLFMLTATVFSVIWIRDYMKDHAPEQKSYLIDEQSGAYEQLLDELNENKAEAIFEAQNKVIQIETPIGSIGSGFLYNRRGDFITNAHVVANAQEVTVVTAQANRHTGRVIGISESEDIAVVRVEELAGKEPLEIEEEPPELEAPVLALGSPLGFQNTVMLGEINGVDQSFTIDPFVYENVDRITAPISPGNSGGPLLHGESLKVIGITSAEEPQEGLGYSIPVLDILDQVDEWIEKPLETLPAFPQYAEQPEDVYVPSQEEAAIYLVQYFYSSLQFGDFVTAYSMMGSQFKEENNYETFRKMFQDTAALSLEATETLVVAENVEVKAVIEAEELEEGEPVNQTYTYRVLIGQENGQLKIKEYTRSD